MVKERSQTARLLREMYDRLDRRFGDLSWWPAKTPFEVIVGAILTQNTNWRNVERAIANLKNENLLTEQGLLAVEEGRLAELLRPSGYYRVKAKRLKAFLHFLFAEYRGDLGKMFAEDPRDLRLKLLGVKGIGEETADSILLYAGGMPVFVVDAYTRRIVSRHGIVNGDASYAEVQRLFMDNLPAEAPLYNQYHALLVQAGKLFCQKEPLCGDCPLREFEKVRSKS